MFNLTVFNFLASCILWGHIIFIVLYNVYTGFFLSVSSHLVCIDLQIVIFFTHNWEKRMGKVLIRVCFVSCMKRKIESVPCIFWTLKTSGGKSFLYFLFWKMISYAKKGVWLWKWNVHIKYIVEMGSDARSH